MIISSDSRPGLRWRSDEGGGGDKISDTAVRRFLHLKPGNININEDTMEDGSLI